MCLFTFNLHRYDERHVGSKVTFRLLNKKWANIYAHEGRDMLLRVDPRDATLVVTRWGLHNLNSVVTHSLKAPGFNP
jgi:hypothetical protein